jgi:RinA family phage transcriptional activator
MKNRISKEEQQTIKAVEKLLYNYKENKDRIEILKLKLDSPTYMNAINYDRVNVITSDISNSVENTILKLEKDRERLKEVTNEIAIIDIAMNLLDDTERRFIKLRFFDRHKWVKICDEFYISERTCYAWKLRILKKVAELINI